MKTRRQFTREFKLGAVKLVGELAAVQLPLPAGWRAQGQQSWYGVPAGEACHHLRFGALDDDAGASRCSLVESRGASNKKSREPLIVVNGRRSMTRSRN
jgi:hypothetical protein